MRYFSCLLLLALGAAPRAVAEPPKLTQKTIEYTSSVDGTKPLYADVVYQPTGKPKPLLVVMHGYSGGRGAVKLDTQELGARGAFCIAPDMRGSGQSKGKWDSGGLDVHDILDAVLYCVKEFAQEIDTKNLNIVGYSGGGGNAISCMVRFPDLFRNSISFFGISDYGWWHDSKGRPDCNVHMVKALGGPPKDLPEVYLARNANPAAANARCGQIHFYWDEGEKDCPIGMIEEFFKVHRAAGLKNLTINKTTKDSTDRWIHGYRSSVRSITKADAIFWPAIDTKDATSPRLPPKGELVVPGYLVTRSFQVWIEDGQKGQVTIQYDLTGKTPEIKVTKNPQAYKIRIEKTSPLATLP